MTALRALVADNLPSQGEIHRPTRVSDGAGGFTLSWAPQGTPKCLLRAAGTSAQERVVAGRIAPSMPWVIRLPAGTSVLAEDRIFIGARQFEVIEPLGPQDLEVGLSVICKER